MDVEAISHRLKVNGVTSLKHAFDPGRLPGRLLGGIVTEITTTMVPSRGTDHRTILTLLEPSTIKSERNITIFHSESIQPNKMKKGDIFLCKGAKANIKFNNFTSFKSLPWAGFDTDTLEKTCEGDTHLICDNTILEVLGLYQTWQKTAQPIPPSPPPTATAHQGRSLPKIGTGRRMIVSTEKMKPKTFIDYVGMVVHCFKTTQLNAAPITTLRLTDYTPNVRSIDLPYSERNDTLVPIDMLINCALFDENSNDCPDDLRFGDYVYIKNALCKLDPHGAMEMAVRHDSYKTTVKIWRLGDTDPLISEIQRLRLAYENLCKRQRQDQQQHEGSMPPAKKPKSYKIRSVLGTVPQGYSFIKDVLLDNYETDHNLIVSIVDYKPKTMAEISVKFCDACGQTSAIEAAQCQRCSNSVDKIVYRCLLQFKDAHGDILMATIYGTNEEPIFGKIPVVNLKENKDVCDQVAEYMDALCPPDQEKGPMLHMCVKAFVYDSCLRCVIQNTKYQLNLE